MIFKKVSLKENVLVYMFMGHEFELMSLTVWWTCYCPFVCRRAIKPFHFTVEECWGGETDIDITLPSVNASSLYLTTEEFK